LVYALKRMYLKGRVADPHVFQTIQTFVATSD